MTQQSDKDSVMQSTKDVAHDTKRVAKTTGKQVKKTSKKLVHKGATATRKASEKVEDKTETTK
jgi:adenylosuccinate lyase